MKDSQNTASAATASALAQLPLRPEWQSATPAQRAVMQRIAIQRDRMLLERLERKHSAATVDASAPIQERLVNFMRLHPAATASFVAAATAAIGTKRLRPLVRLAQTSLPTVLMLLARLRP